MAGSARPTFKAGRTTTSPIAVHGEFRRNGMHSQKERMSLIRLLHLDPLSAFGLVAVGLMLAFYAMEGRSRHYTLLFAGACAMGSCYGFMQGAWPFGLVEGVWSLVAARKWQRLVAGPSQASKNRPAPPDCVEAFMEDLRRVAAQASPTTFSFAGENGIPCGYVQLYRPCSGRLLMHRLWTVTRGVGAGSRILQTLCDLADLHGVEIVLRPLPFGAEPFPLSAGQLRDWYHRHGFAGSDKNMLRNPRPPQAPNNSVEIGAPIMQNSLQ